MIIYFESQNQKYSGCFNKDRNQQRQKYTKIKINKDRNQQRQKYTKYYPIFGIFVYS